MAAAAFALPLIGGLAGFFGGLGDKKSTTDKSSWENTSAQGYGSKTPTLNPLQQQLSGLFTRGAIDQYNRGTNLAPYTSQGLQGIQSQGSQNSRAIAANLANRGLSYSPMSGAATTQNQINTGNQMQGFLQGVPLLQRQMNMQNLAQLMDAFKTMPTGESTQSSSYGSSVGGEHGETVQKGSLLGGIAGGLSGLGAGLAGPYGLSGDTGTQSNLGAIMQRFGLNAGNRNAGAGQQPASQTQGSFWPGGFMPDFTGMFGGSPFGIGGV